MYFSKSIQSYIFTNVMRLSVSPQLCWIFFIFVHQLSKWYSIAILICPFLIVVRLRIFSCVYQPLYLFLWVAYLLPLPSFLLVSLCLTGFFFKDLFYDCDDMIVDINTLLQIFLPDSYPFVVSGVRGPLSFNFMVTLIYETLCVKLDCVK